MVIIFNFRINSKFQILFFCLLLTTCLAPSIRAQENASQTTAETLIEAFQRHSQVPGVSASVAVKGEIVWSAGFGYADLEQEVPVRAGLTKFRIGSVSKPLTAAALGLLYDQGKINLDAPIQAYVPDFPEKEWPISLRQLAGHIAGIRHYRGPAEWLSARRYTNVAEGLEIFADDPLLFEPGERYSYSSYAWNLISAAVENVAEEDFLDYMEQEVFSPLGMTHTDADFTDSLVSHRTRFYTISGDGQLINAPFVDNSYKWAGGGFVATTDDLVRFGSAHLQAGFLSDTTLQTWLRSQATNDGTPTNYGIGWRSGSDAQGRPWYGHSGGSVGGITQLVVYPEQEVVVAILTNSDQVEYGDTHHQLARLFFPPITEEPGLPDWVKAMAGSYDMEDGNTITIIGQGEQLLARFNDRLPQLLLYSPEEKSLTNLLGTYKLRLGEEYEILLVPQEEAPIRGVKVED